MDIRRYAHDTSSYHQALKKAYRSIANAFLVFGSVFIVAGAIQVRLLPKVRQPTGREARL
jgi:hypothetical protein